MSFFQGYPHNINYCCWVGGLSSWKEEWRVESSLLVWTGDEVTDRRRKRIGERIKSWKEDLNCCKLLLFRVDSKTLERTGFKAIRRCLVGWEGSPFFCKVRIRSFFQHFRKTAEYNKQSQKSIPRQNAKLGSIDFECHKNYTVDHTPS